MPEFPWKKELPSAGTVRVPQAAASAAPDPLPEISAYAARITGHTLGCACLACDGWRWRYWQGKVIRE